MDPAICSRQGLLGSQGPGSDQKQHVLACEAAGPGWVDQPTAAPRSQAANICDTTLQPSLRNSHVPTLLPIHLARADWQCNHAYLSCCGSCGCSVPPAADMRWRAARPRGSASSRSCPAGGWRRRRSGSLPAPPTRSTKIENLITSAATASCSCVQGALKCAFWLLCAELGLCQLLLRTGRAQMRWWPKGPGDRTRKRSRTGR